jgi:hypothetical protein
MAYADEVLADNPHAYLRLNEVSGVIAADSSGNNNVGTYVGAPAMGVTGLIATDVDTAIQTTVNQQITVPYTLSTNTFSVELWWKWTAPGTPGGVLRDHTSAGGTGYIIDASSTGVNVLIAGGSNRLTTTVNYQDGIRHHFVLTYDGVNANFYIDGALVDSWAKTSSVRPATPLHIGYNGTNNNQYQPGIYDECALYGSVLSASRVAAHYETASSLPSDARVATLYLEAMATGISSARVETAYLETMTTGVPVAQVEASYLEVMSRVEPRSVARFVGWGAPI